MKKLIQIGNLVFRYKKEVISHYREILNQYSFHEVASAKHKDEILALLKYSDFFRNESREKPFDDPSYEAFIRSIVLEISVEKVQFNTKCFCIHYDDGTAQLISYLQIINKHKVTPLSVFRIACRNEIQDDLIAVKQQYFSDYAKKSHAPCQETGEWSKWEGLVVDHRQPNTFSIILDRFIELEGLDLGKLDYFKDESNMVRLEDRTIAEKFHKYHTEKALLRVVKKERNASRSAMARVKKSQKDLTVE